MTASALAALLVLAAAAAPQDSQPSSSPPPEAAEAAPQANDEATETAATDAEVDAAETADASHPAPASPSADAAGKTLWLVQPLYPGQELLVSRTEEVISQLLPEAERDRELVGRAELAANLEGVQGTLDCIFGSVKCADPVGALVGSIGVERVVLIKVGQEGTGYRFRVASFQPGNLETATAESEHANMERALLGAIVRVAPLAAMVEVVSDPPGATVRIDGERVGTTPLNTQVLPGERQIRLELAFHEAQESSLIVPVRGQVRVEEALTKLPGSLRVVSPGATIFLNGKEVGTDEVEVGATAGTHVVRLERDGYAAHEFEVEVKPEGVTEVERTLEPTFWESVGQSFSRSHREIYSQGGFVAFVYDDITLSGDRFAARAIRKEIERRVGGDARIQSFGIELGSNWRNFGMMWFGASYFRTPEEWNFALDDDEVFRGSVNGGTLRLLQPQLRLAIWRFILGVRGGVLARGGIASGGDDTFLFGDVGAEARGTLQLHIFKGLYIEGGIGRTWTLAGSLDGSDEIRGGIGYAY